MAAAPGIVTASSPPNAVVQIQAGMQVQPVVLVDQNGNYITAPSSVMTTRGDMIYENATPAPARLAIGTTGQVLGVSGGQPAWQAGLSLLATTGAAGFALQNATPTILTWTAPNDGLAHRASIALLESVTSATTGGSVQVVYTDPGGSPHSATLIAGTQGTGGKLSSSVAFIPIQAGSAFTISQGSAMTAGAATVWAEIWGS